ncbi:pyrroline-5-carboxylate reductase [Varibaculum vaginae]|uniref:pyrroline-5-carboxylate reductase n=1 Tax=Varibaculum vaginae TaxID=2364797 RepID=UPI000F0744F2|nr:pyrroline-5-carboxylate reductase [Varibaculum vaginae]
MVKLGVIGVGSMGGAIVRGLLSSGQLQTEDILVFNRTRSRMRALEEQFPLSVAPNAATVAREANYLLLGVKPHMLTPLLDDLGDALAAKPIVVSVAAGKSLADIAAHLPAKTPIVRVMPNVNAQINQSISGIAANQYVSEKALGEVQEMFDAIGKTALVPEEKFAAFAALAGCSPAWIYRFIDALAQAGVAHGFTKTQATQIVAQAVAGSALNVLHNLPQGLNPQALVDQVCSPAGTTVAGLLAMEDAGFSVATRAAVNAAVARDQELSTS